MTKTQPDQLVARLKARGLNFHQADLEHALKRIGYFRLLIYMRPFQNSAKQFHSGTTFNQIMSLYEFDRKLKFICMEAIERVEVALRVAVTESLGTELGSHFHCVPANFYQQYGFERFWKKADEADSVAITHYQRRYTIPPHPPVWVLLEAVTIGTLSKFFADLTVSNRNKIAKKFSFSEKILVSWYRSLTVLRNNCAHHSRVWNSKFTVNTPIAPTLHVKKFRAMNSFHAQVTILYLLLHDIEPVSADSWRDSLKALFDKYSTVVDLTQMGFVEQDPFWS